jgi:superfamily II DNA or RNA helicase
MSGQSPIVIKDGAAIPACVLREYEEFGFPSADLVYPPRRFWGDREGPVPTFEGSVDANRLQRLPTPSQLFGALPEGDNWTAQSRRSVTRLRVFFLICEDPQRRLEARAVSTLSHQISLVHHILEKEHLRRVLVADEVGLGKTVEVGLLIGQLLERSPGLRVLYLAPARLVSNVRQEFERLGLSFRQWTAEDADARLTDPRVIASIHRAVHAKHFQNVIDTAAWDVIVVDECHHLSDWAPFGGDPREKFKLVRDLIARQRDDGRVLFLSGTPHQGHESRFANLLALLQRPNENLESLRGRVIYRTKEDVRDWHGNPLFPTRQVNDPLVVDLGPLYRSWVQSIHHFYRPPKEALKRGEARRRAAGWRWAQALQWAVSSPQAGLGYLVRQAVRGGWDLRSKALADAVAALRPYRSGRDDEPVEQLYQRIRKEVDRQREAADVEDIEEEEGEGGAFQKAALEKLLTDGIAVLRESGDQKWRTIKENLLDPAGQEKVVLFAQPIETVIALARYLEEVTGTRPALIIGGQSDADRREQVEQFWKPDGPQYLVSSRAGGEGINLQVARRLVHIDVPWNPMDLEQRVGRVHRFGSRKTVLVDTVVVKDSREAQAYRIARQRLSLIASTLVEPERFEAVFARVMCLVPPEDLQDVLLQDSFGPFRPEDQDQIARMVREGFQAWRDFHQRFAEQQKQIQHRDPGLANWADLESFLREYSDAQPLEGYNAQRFLEKEGQVEPVEHGTNVLTLGDGQGYVCGDTGGAPVFGPDGRAARQLGLNLKPVSELLRRFAFPTSAVGAACLRWPRGFPPPRPDAKLPFGVLVFLRQTVRADQRAGYVEYASSLHCYLAIPGRTPVQLLSSEKHGLFQALFEASPLRTMPEAGGLVSDLSRYEWVLANELRRPAESERAAGIRHAVMPLLAAVVVS